MNKKQKKLVTELRREALDLKDCFTRYSFYAIAISGVVFGIGPQLQGFSPYIPVTSIVIITLLLAVARIGTYKYGGANRNIGYELHLYRSQALGDSRFNRIGLHPIGWHSKMRNISWEEAMRAWRVVQATIFQHLYVYNLLLPNWLRSKPKKMRKSDEGKKKLWFEPGTLVKNAGVGAAYHSGRYLRIMLSMLHILALVSTIPIWVLTVQLRMNGDDTWICTGLFSASLVLFVFFRAAKDLARVRILETGLLSIHSSAVLWQAVVVAHYRALEKTRVGNGVGLENYTANLAIVASELRSEIYDIDKWIGYDSNNKEIIALDEIQLATLRSELTEIPDVGAKMARKLLRTLGSVKAVREASEEAIAVVVGPAAARKVRAHFDGGGELEAPAP